MNFCMHCGAPLNGVDANFCPSCGKRLKPAAPVGPVKEEVVEEVTVAEEPVVSVEETPAAVEEVPVAEEPELPEATEGDTPVTLEELMADPVAEEPASAPEAPKAAPAATPAASAPDNSKKKTLIIGIAAAIVIVLLIIGGLVLRGGSDASGAAAPDLFGSGGTQFEKLEAEIQDSYYVDAKLVSTDVSEYPKVKLYFNITDEYGDSVSLAKAKAAIRERLSGGEFVEREVKSIQRLEGREGLSIDLVVDKSGSMDGSLYRVQEVMTQFVESLDYKAGDKVEIISFDSYVMYMCSYTSDVNLMRNGIYNMTPYGMTALYDALAEGITNAKNQGGARCVIAFTDGYDNESYHTPGEIINMACNYGVPVFIIGAGDVDSYTLQNIAHSTGGYYWDIDDLYDMNDILRQIYDEQKDMYCVEYISDSSIGQYDERNIQYIISDGDYGSSGDQYFTPIKTIEKVQHSSRYELVKETVSWSEANQAAINKGGHLATITSESEMQQLSQMAEKAGLKYVWLGGYTSVRYDEAFGHWVTGENFDYTAWYPGEPSRNDKDGAPEMYLMLWKVQDEWSWNDQRNDPAGETGIKSFIDATGYIIEYEN